MEERRDTEELSRAAHEFSGAVDRFVEYVDRLEHVVPKPGLSDHDADSYALKVVHRAREELGRKTEAEAPSWEDVEKWERLREDRRAEQYRGT